MNTYYIYKHTTPNNKVYIGKTTNYMRRWNNGNGYKNNTYFYRAIQKYGWKNISHEIIASGLSSEEADKLEIKLISEYNSTDYRYGFNNTAGGDGCLGFSPSEITREKRRIAMTGKRTGYKMSEETKEKIRQKAIGRKLSEETKIKISEAGKGRKHTEESKNKISASLKLRKPETYAFLGKNLSEEHKQNISKGNKGKKRTDLQKYKIALSKPRVPVICVETGEKFISLKSAMRAMKGKNISGIKSAIKKGTKSYGYHWKQIKED
jgi:hypothetical protein